MYCPRCGVEYRQGFTHCTDCDVDLVWERAQKIEIARPTSGFGEAPHDRVPGEPGDPNEDPFCSFWKGEDARVHAELCQVLDDVGIPHNTVYRRDHLFNLTNYPSYEVGVPFSLFERAENAVKDAYGTDDVADVGTSELQGKALPERARERILPETLMPRIDEDIPGPPSAGEVEYWFPEDATVAVWSSGQGARTDFLIAVFHENGIRCRVDTSSGGSAIFVLPQDESRARDIVRQVVENAPLEE